MRFIYFYLFISISFNCRDDDNGGPWVPPVQMPDCINEVSDSFIERLPGDQQTGTLIGKKNMLDWSASALGKIDFGNRYKVLSYTVNDKDWLREKLSFILHYNDSLDTYIPLDALEHEFIDGSVVYNYLTFEEAGDVIEDIYLLDSSACDNMFVIDSIDGINNIYTGKFTVTFDRDTTRNKVNPLNPERVKFDDILFEVELEQ